MHTLLPNDCTDALVDLQVKSSVIHRGCTHQENDGTTGENETSPPPYSPPYSPPRPPRPYFTTRTIVPSPPLSLSPPLLSERFWRQLIGNTCPSRKRYMSINKKIVPTSTSMMRPFSPSTRPFCVANAASKAPLSLLVGKGVSLRSSTTRLFSSACQRDACACVERDKRLPRRPHGNANPPVNTRLRFGFPSLSAAS